MQLGGHQMSYTLLKQEKLNDLQGVGYLYQHNKTKAKICFISTEDDNKTFSIAFRTPPRDSTGVAHIIEHSVLCGSKKYPVKDPFIELAKGSLNTFLNAMTFSDKTMYPVASVNEKDFHNLMDVYLDAVFYPNIYTEKKTFDQEGWHYELDDVNGHVEYKGVVYNEMKGVFSSPEQTLLRSIQAELFSEHVYGVESGGDPMDIPNLTYEDFLEFHRNYYHPSNSYIYYYGDMDVEQELERLDSMYLSNFEYRQVDSAIELMQRYAAPKKVEGDYPIAEDEPMDKRTYLSYNVLLDESKHVVESMAMDILEYLLVDAPAAPIKEALLDAGIGEDVFSSYDDSKREGNFSIIAKNSDANQQNNFVDVIETTLARIVKDGFDQDKLQAAINKFEFRVKEADFGQYPTGVIYAIKTLETWLYDEDPFVHYYYDDLFDALKQKADEGLFEQLIERYFLNNPHKVYLTLKPNKAFNSAKEDVIRKRLETYEQSLSEQERQALYEYTQELIRFQDAPDTQEDLDKLPQLTLEDIPRDKKEFTYTTDMLDDTKVLFREAQSKDIVYVKAAFDVSHVSEEQLAILSMLTKFLVQLSTEKNHYGLLSDKINKNTGGIHIKLSVYDHKDSVKYYSPMLEVVGKSFVEQLGQMYGLFHEIITQTRFDEVKRMRELLNEIKSRLQMSLKSRGHSSATLRAQSYMSASGSYKEHIQGISFYDEVCDWQSRSDEELKELGILMQRILESIITNDGLTLAITASGEYRNTIFNHTNEFVFSLPNKKRTMEKAVVELSTPINEGVKTISDVQYVAMVGNFKQHGFDYQGSLKVLNTIISLNYLWNQVRIKGGAYGAFSGVSRNGMLTFSSYRDPNLGKTMDVYQGVAEFIETLDLSEKELTKYIIGTMSNFDRPLTPTMENDKMMSMYFSEITHDDVLNNRHEILDTTLETLKSYREMYQKIFVKPMFCVLGNEGKIEAEKERFEAVRTLS